MCDFSEDVDEEEVVIERPILIFSSEAEHPVVFELVAIGGIELISLYDFMPGDALVCF